ncbi:hypothetical protein BTA51_01170 [Hahella sp. CCB-MM4]|nr:hypothetical protein BTA51_01170 [Hahella sp. CCB-MM4]
MEQLHHYNVDVVADIRSVPYSKAFHDYHQEALRHTLKASGIGYVYLGPELGPRSKDPAHYDERRQVQFDRLMESALFKSGIQRLFDGIDKGYTIALSCAEKDPAICHRSLLVGWSLLHQYGCELQHILHEGELEGQIALESRLMQTTDTFPDMLMDEPEAIQLAYRRQCQNCAYRIPEAD